MKSSASSKLLDPSDMTKEKMIWNINQSKYMFKGEWAHILNKVLYCLYQILKKKMFQLWKNKIMFLYIRLPENATQCALSHPSKKLPIVRLLYKEFVVSSTVIEKLIKYCGFINICCALIFMDFAVWLHNDEQNQIFIKVRNWAKYCSGRTIFNKFGHHWRIWMKPH